MARSAKHTHRMVVISFSRNPRHPSLTRGCAGRTCAKIEIVCPLCEEDGNRRRHRRHHAPVTDRQVFNRSLLALTKAAIEYETLWGKPVWTNRDRGCTVHGFEHWTSREQIATGHFACEVCHPSGMNGHDHELCRATARLLGGAEERQVDDVVLEAAPD